MINVRIRGEWDQFAVPLGTMPYDPADPETGERILRAVAHEGVYDMADGEVVNDVARLSSQIVYDGVVGAAYFEVVILDSEGE